MISPTLLRQVRRLHLRARRAVKSLLGGAYHSAFKGVGLSFEEVREYQPGDDVRAIDWNVTARAGKPFIKRFVEERELTIVLAVDVSGSQCVEMAQPTKRAVAADLAALLGLCAIGNNDRVGLVCFTDTVEHYVPPGRGQRHAMRLLRDVLAFDPKGVKTDLSAALNYINKVQRRRAIVFAIGDFLGEDFAAAFRRTARKHDLIAIRITTLRESDWPAVGLLQLQDAETGEQMIVDTTSRSFRAGFTARVGDRTIHLKQLAQRSGAGLIEIGTNGDHVEALLNYFRSWNSRSRTRS